MINKETQKELLQKPVQARDQTEELAEQNFHKEIQKQNKVIHVQKITNVIFIGLISFSMYKAQNSVESIIKMTGSFVGSFEICILPAMMFFVINKRY